MKMCRYGFNMAKTFSVAIMSGQLILRRLVNNIRWQQVRSCAVVAAKAPYEVKIYPVEQMTAELKDHHHPVSGAQRDIVGHGWSNDGTYLDDVEWPCSGVRFKMNTPEIVALRAKEFEDNWSSLTLEDKRELYRATYCETFEEMLAPTGEWKRQLIMVLFGCLMTQIWMVIQDAYILPAPSIRLQEGSMDALFHKMIENREGIMYGYASRYDYDKGDWKPGFEPKRKSFS